MSGIKTGVRENAARSARPSVSNTEQAARPAPQQPTRPAAPAPRDQFVRGNRPASQAERPLFMQPSYWRDVGLVLRGEVKGVVGAVTGTVHAVTHPVETARGIVRAVKDPVGTAQAAWNNAKRPFETGDYEGMGRVIGGTAAAVVGPKVLARAPAVAFGERLSAAEIGTIGRAVHVTQRQHLPSISQGGLHASQGLYKNLTTFGRESVYMFSREPGAAQRAMNLAGRDAASQVSVGVDLTRLDPKLLYIRRADGAITYRDPAGIPSSALILPP